VSHRIQDCIRDWDVEGEGNSLAEALGAIADECEKDAARLEVDVAELRKAAARYRAMRALCDEPADPEPPDGDAPES
jgi:hypothetical protein